MKILFCSLVVGFCLVGISVGQAPAQPQVPSQAPPAPASNANHPMTMNFTLGTLIRAQLEKTIDSKKALIGDQVLAQTTDDLNSVPPGLATRGCRIIGHIVEVVPHQGNSGSTLRVVFDKMILKNGSEMALPATIQAVGFADRFESARSPVPQSGGAPGNYVGSRMPNANSSVVEKKLPFDAKGAIGMSEVTLSAGSAQDSILTARKKNIKLESGMQMILRTD